MYIYIGLTRNNFKVNEYLAKAKAHRHRVAALEAVFDHVRGELLQRKFSDLSIGLMVNPIDRQEER